MDTFNPKVRIIKSPKEFKKEIWQWTPNNYPCLLCKIFVQNIGLQSPGVLKIYIPGSKMK